MIRAVFVQNETLGAYKTEVTIFTGRSVSISESHLENVLWALFLCVSTSGVWMRKYGCKLACIAMNFLIHIARQRIMSKTRSVCECPLLHLISGLLPLFGHREGEENEQYYISRKYIRTEN